MTTNRSLFFASVTLILEVFFCARLFAQSASKPDGVVQDGSVVSFEYMLSDEGGNVIESSKGKPPMSYTHGRGEIIPGLEKELAGMKVGGEKHVRVKAEDGYGPVDPNAFREVPKEQLPPDALKVGAQLVARGPGGQAIPVRVHEIKENTVVIDLNHPMAGKTLTFDVKITEIK
jgi:FKBP-type peptidyl-prolyl cis-trans isomerase SlyD